MMDSLPYEIIVRIFEYLPLFDRHKVRLVSRSWNSACNDPLITKGEILNFYRKTRLSTIPEVFSTLMGTKRSILNLKFDRLYEPDPLFSNDNASSDFWLKNGTNVRYLKFSNCHDAHHLFRVLECCPNLIELHCFRLEKDFIDMLHLLFENNVILMKVTCLSVVYTRLERKSVKEELPKVFPNIQNLHITPECFKNLCFDIVEYVLKISSHLKYLNLSFMRYWTSPYLLVEEKITKILVAAKQLKTLKLTRARFLTWQNMSQLSALNDLTTLSLDTLGNGLPLCEYLVQILDIVPNLRHLEVTAENVFGQIDDNVANKLSTSSLQTLKIKVGSSWWVNNDRNRNLGEVTVSRCTPNDILEKLDLCLHIHTLYELHDHERSVANAVITFFMKYFRKLKHLYSIFPLSNTTFETMRSHQENLISLKMKLDLGGHSSAISNGGSADSPDCDLNEYPAFQGFSFRQFKYLEDLTLSIASWFSSEQYSFSDFVLPRLKNLQVEFLWELGEDPSESEVCQVPSNLFNFLHAIEKSPRLEFFSLKNYQQNIPYDLVVRQCESHQNLRYLLLIKELPRTIYHYYSAEQYEQISKLFRISESLRFVYHDERAFRKNICTNEIQPSSDEIFG